MKGWYWLIRRLSFKQETWQARTAPAYVHNSTSTLCSYSCVKAKLTVVIATTVLTAMRLSPKHQQKTATLMVGDQFTFSQMMVSPTGFCVTTCRGCSIKEKLRIWVLYFKPLQLDKMSDAVWQKCVATSKAAVHPKEWLLFTSYSTCFRYLAVSDSCTHNRQKLC